jgi:hypothetical protein
VKNGTVTAGNSSPLNDGASAVLIGSEKAGLKPLARIAGRGTYAVDPDVFGIGPVEAANRALKRAGSRGTTSTSPSSTRRSRRSRSPAWPTGRPRPDKLNPHGGAIALGHPLGASGARILGRSPTAQGAPAASTASPRSASASGRVWRSCGGRMIDPPLDYPATRRPHCGHPKRPLIELRAGSRTCPRRARAMTASARSTTTSPDSTTASRRASGSSSTAA